MIIYFTRHGETVGNVERIVQGHLPGELTNEGREQARKVASRLSSEKIDAIYSSDLKRAADTAREIARFHEAPVYFVDTLRERNYGILEGRKITDVDWDRMDNDINVAEFRAESVKDMFARIQNVISELFVRHRDDKVLIVGHGSMGKAIVGNMTGKSPKDYRDIELPKNTSISVFEIEANGKSRTLVFNCVKHLS